MQFLDLAKEIIRFNCDFLRVPVPSVRIAEPSEFATRTTRAAVSIDGRKMLINSAFSDCSDVPFVWLMLSHECRHVWQIRNAEKFDNYQTSAKLSLADYNSQPEEVDAWAWSVIVVSEKFGVRPTLEKNFGAAVWTQIQQRARQIADEGLF